MKRFLLVVQLLMFAVIGNSQYNIVLIPSGNYYLRSQLWSLSISSTNGSSPSARISMQLKEQGTGQVVLTGVSNAFVLTPGAHVMQMQSFEPIVYSNGSSGNVSDNNMLPIGKYQVCYQLYLSDGDAETIAAEDCELLAVEPMSPPMLNFPENDSVLTSLSPTFLWIPPVPLAMFSNLNYDIIITEVFNGQSITDAIQHNLPTQEYHALQQPTYSYTLQGVALEAGKAYAWQVVARDGPQYAAKSEVWRFTVADKKDSIPSVSNVYLLMDNKMNGVETIVSDTLHVKYVSSSVSHKTDIIFKDQNGTVVYTVSKEMKQGDNYWDIPLIGKFDRQKIYSAIVNESDLKSGTIFFQHQ